MGEFVVFVFYSSRHGDKETGSAYWIKIVTTYLISYQYLFDIFIEKARISKY